MKYLIFSSLAGVVAVLLTLRDASPEKERVEKAAAKGRWMSLADDTKRAAFRKVDVAIIVD